MHSRHPDVTGQSVAASVWGILTIPVLGDVKVTVRLRFDPRPAIGSRRC